MPQVLQVWCVYIYIYLSIRICINIYISIVYMFDQPLAPTDMMISNIMSFLHGACMCIPVVRHEAVAEVSKIGNLLSERPNDRMKRGCNFLVDVSVCVPDCLAVRLSAFLSIYRSI